MKSVRRSQELTVPHLRTPTVHRTKLDAIEVLDARENRKRRVGALVTGVFSSLPEEIMELNALLSSSAIDLTKASKIIRTDATLYVQVLRQANAALGSLRQPVLEITEAIVLLGAERVRTLVLAQSFVKAAGQHVSREELQDFWQHSLTTAKFSERIARRVGFIETEDAYIGGLLHDIGRLPLLIVAHEDTGAGCGIGKEWQNNLSLEREFFGIDHSEAGRLIGTAWNIAPAFIDAIAYHHSPLNAQPDPCLFGIVAAGDYYSKLPVAADEHQSEEAFLAVVNAGAFLRIRLPQLWVQDRTAGRIS
jgi:putative nucleotidyltransferase with HDIG domain